jgi:hypothetical protein
MGPNEPELSFDIAQIALIAFVDKLVSKSL